MATKKTTGEEAQAPESAKTGRPSDYSQELADLICERISDGESLRTICMAEDMPNKATVFRWLAANKMFSDQYTRAREVQAETMAEDILQIADDGANDTYVDDEGNRRTDYDVIARSKLRVDARKWLASKLAPKKYSDKIDLNHGGQENNPVEVKTKVVVVPSKQAAETIVKKLEREGD